MIANDDQVIDDQPNTGFKTPNQFCLHLEKIKEQQHLDSYIEAIVWYSEHESDLEIEQLVRFLNKKVRDAIAYEARTMNMLKDNDELVSLF